jgi:prophage antirepressor-like protein
VTQLQTFNNGEFELQVIPAGISFKVIAPGLARALAFHSAKDMLRHVPDDEKGWEIAPTLGGDQRLQFVWEPGFYRVLGQRQTTRIKNLAVRATVDRFQRWVYHEVLPALRRTGTYQVQQPQSPQVGFGINVFQPDFFTYDEVCALLRQMFGINLTVNELTRNMRAGGVLKQNGAPTKKYWHWFWFTNSAWNVQSHVVPQVAFKVYETGREMQDWRFLQARLLLDGVGQPPEFLPQRQRQQIDP